MIALKLKEKEKTIGTKKTNGSASKTLPAKKKKKKQTEVESKTAKTVPHYTKKKLQVLKKRNEVPVKLHLLPPPYETPIKNAKKTKWQNLTLIESAKIGVTTESDQRTESTKNRTFLGRKGRT